MGGASGALTSASGGLDELTLAGHPPCRSADLPGPLALKIRWSLWGANRQWESAEPFSLELARKNPGSRRGVGLPAGRTPI